VRFELGQRQPNPFNLHTRITMALPEATNWTLDIYNVNGQLLGRGGAAAPGTGWAGRVGEGAKNPRLLAKNSLSPSRKWSRVPG